MNDASGSSDTGVPATGIVSVKTAAVLAPEYRLAAMHHVPKDRLCCAQFVIHCLARLLQRTVALPSPTATHHRLQPCRRHAPPGECSDGKAGCGRWPKAAFFCVGTAAHDADDHIIRNKATSGLFYDSNGIVAGGVTQLATLV